MHNSNAITDLGGNANQLNGVGRLFAFFTQATYAFGFNYVSGGISLVAIVFNVAGCCEALNTTGASGFIGVVSDTSMASADFFNAQLPNNGGADRYFIDDFRINAPIPEPATGGLMALGLLATGALARRRSKNLTVSGPGAAGCRPASDSLAADRDQLDFKKQRRVWRDRPARGAAFAIGDGRWAGQLGLAADLHFLHALGPAFDDPVERKFCRRVALVRAVEFAVRLSWAKLLKRVFEIDMEHCPNCGGELKIIAAIL